VKKAEVVKKKLARDQRYEHHFITFDVMSPGQFQKQETPTNLADASQGGRLPRRFVQDILKQVPVRDTGGEHE